MNSKVISVLLVDDDEDDYFLTREYFGDLKNWRFDITWCSNFAAAQKAIQTKKFDIYLFDYLLGIHTGIQLIEYALGLGCEEPIILLTGKGDANIAVEALRLGATDYLVKSELEAEKLERSIRYALERVSVLKALKNSERRYRRIFEESSDFLFISSLDGKILDFNSAASQLTGYPAEDLKDRNILELVDIAGLRGRWDSIMGSNILDQEVNLSTKDGDRKYCLFSASVEMDGETEYVQGRIHDMTNRKRAEKEKTFSEKMEVTSRLVRMLAHEVRNPLANVNLSAEQLEMELEDEDQKMYTQIIKRNCTRINDLITQLLQPSNYADLELVQRSINQTIDEAIASALDRVRLKRIRIENQYDAHDFLLPLDTVSMQMAFLNIITNAIEAMEEDRGVLVISSRKIGDTFQIIFTDNGSGISEESIDKIFEPYYTGKSNGMGIGLPTAMSIIHAHHGSIDVESELGVGTTFIISFGKAS